MPYTDPTVRQRIVAQLLATLVDAFGTELGAANIQEFSEAGNAPVEKTAGAGDLPAAWILLTAGEDDIDNEEATTGMTCKVMPVTIDVHLLQPLPTGYTMAQWGREWAARVEAAVHGDPQVTEDESEKELAIDMLMVEAFYPVPHDRQRDNLAGITVEVRYDHLEADPWTGRADIE